jgi:glycosyltransferase involved in cell wall biosynthesis
MQTAGKGRLLLVLPTVPWPPRRNGTALRFVPIIAHLAARYELDLLVLADPPEPLAVEGPLLACREVSTMQVPHLVQPPPLRKLGTLYRGLVPWGLPLGSLRPVAVGPLTQQISEHINRHGYDTVLWGAGFSLDVACAVRRRCPQVRFVVDMVDSPTLLAERSVSLDAFLMPLRGYTAWKWRRMEARVQDTCDATIYITGPDAHAARADPPATVHVVPNGLFLEDAPAAARPRHAGRVLGFLGNMAYQPNVSAVLRLATRILPRLRSRWPDATLLVIGRAPPPAVLALAGPAVTVTGEVDEIWTHLAAADVFVFPMIEGAGLQNKILEVMHAERPVVTTNISAAGIGASDGEQLLAGDSDDEIVSRVERLFAEPELGTRLVERARAFVAREFAWGPILKRYESVLAAPAASYRAADTAAAGG